MGKQTATFSAYSSLRQSLLTALSGDRRLVVFPEQTSYQSANVGCNLEISLKPTAITFPRTVEHIQAIVKCALEHHLHVQARSGGHSYGNFGLGGADGAIVIDLKYFQYVSVDHSTWVATIGAGTRLEDVTKQLYASGKRAITHGTCPSVGIGGHATIGGLGPTARMWGSCLDHIQEMKVVLANSTVVTASEKLNPDLFFALRGAAAGFGIIVEFKFRTRPAPDEAVQFSHTLIGSYASMADTFNQWQNDISDPNLTRKLFTQAIITTRGMTIVGTYFGSEDEFKSERFAQRYVYPKPQRPPLDRARSSGSIRKMLLTKRTAAAPRIEVQVYKNNWLGLLREWAGGRLLSKVIGRPSHFYHKSMTVNSGEKINAENINELFFYLDTAKKGTPIWFIICDMVGGAVNDVSETETAFPHRDVGFYVQSYVISLGKVSETSKAFVRGVHDIAQRGLDTEDGAIYPGYVDLEMQNAQSRYWGANLERLERIKDRFDPRDVFQNPQSVRPPRGNCKVAVGRAR